MITLPENSCCEKTTTHPFPWTLLKARQGFAPLLMGREGRLECSGAGTVIYRMAVLSMAGLLRGCHTEAITTWWFSFHSSLSSLGWLCWGVREQRTRCCPVLLAEGSGGGRYRPSPGQWYVLSLTGRCLSWWNKVWDILWHSLLHGWGAHFVQSGCGLDLALGCSCREDVITKAHTLGRRHLSLPFAELVSLHLRLFQGPECNLGQSLGLAEGVPVLLCIPSVWPPTIWVGITKTWSCSSEVWSPPSRQTNVFV